MSTEYTRGTWEFCEGQLNNTDDSQLDKIGCVATDEWIVAEICGDIEEGRANAYLIAAAPDLYEALEMVRDADEDCRKDGLDVIPPSARAKIDAALAKAEGRDV